MITQIRKWGNGQGILLSKKVLKEARFEVDDIINIGVNDGEIILCKDFHHKTLEERTRGFEVWNGLTGSFDRCILKQGDLIIVENYSNPLLIVSQEILNASGIIYCCPIFSDSIENPFHIWILAGMVQGFVQCEKISAVDLNKRKYEWIGKISVFDLMNISDVIQGIFGR